MRLAAANRLLEWLSLPDWDRELGIEPAERRMFTAHVAETHVLTSDNLERLAERKLDLVFNPALGFAGRGLLDSSSVGRPATPAP